MTSDVLGSADVYVCVCVCVCVCVESRSLPPRGDSGNTVYTVAKASSCSLECVE